VAENVDDAPTQTDLPPLYAQLVANMAAQLRQAGDRYDRAADDSSVRAGHRFDWCSILGTRSGSRHGCVPARGR
jgi:hypothetical protein